MKSPELIVYLSVESFSPATVEDYVRRVIDEQLRPAPGAVPQGLDLSLLLVHVLPEEGVDELDWHQRLGMWYAVAVGDPGRSEADEADVQALRSILARHGADPGWEPCAIDPTLRRPT